MPWVKTQRVDPAIGARVRAAVAQDFGIPSDDLLSRGKRIGDRNHSTARQVATYIVSVTLGYGEAATSEYFGFDHTTVRHGCARIEDMRDNGPFDDRLTAIEDLFVHDGVEA